MKYDAVVFDMDGTLLDSVPEITRIVNGVIADIGMAPRDQDEIRNAVGYGIVQLLRNIGVPEEWTGPLADQVGAVYARTEKTTARLFEGAEEMIRTAAENGLKIAVLSNRPTEGLRKAVAHHLPALDFHSVLGSSPEKPAKPDPQVLLKTAEVLGVEPARMVMVGDGEPDVMAAEAAGAEHLAVLWGYCGRSGLEGAGARNFAEDPAQVIEFILRED